MSKHKQSKGSAEPTAADLLAELATLEVEAERATDAHSRVGWPAWAEVILTARRIGESPLNIKAPLRTHDAELIIEVLHNLLHPTAGGAAADQLWGDLDNVLERIMRRVHRGKDPLKADMGEARGLTRALALMTNPYDPDEDVVKGVAMERYEVRNGLGTDSEDE
jgi:hypothetical protein